MDEPIDALDYAEKALRFDPKHVTWITSQLSQHYSRPPPKDRNKTDTSATYGSPMGSCEISYDLQEFIFMGFGSPSSPNCLKINSMR